MSLPAVLINTVTGEILKFGNYPREDMQPIEGGDPTYEWLLLRTPFKSPEYDSRMWLLVTKLPKLGEMALDGTLDQLPTHPAHPSFKTYTTTYALEKRSNDYILGQIANAEDAANMDVLSYRTTDKMLLTSASILARVKGGVQPSESEQEMLDKLMAFDVLVQKNDAEKRLKIQQIEAGLEVDIDAGWEKGATNVGA